MLPHFLRKNIYDSAAQKISTICR